MVQVHVNLSCYFFLTEGSDKDDMYRFKGYILDTFISYKRSI